MDPTKTSKHLKILVIGNAERMNTALDIHHFLATLTTLIGMKPLGLPNVKVVSKAIDEMGFDATGDEGGVSGVQMIATSHISVHTWPEQELAVIDVFSCIGFDTTLAVTYCVEYFWGKRWKVTDISHSLMWE